MGQVPCTVSLANVWDAGGTRAGPHCARRGDRAVQGTSVWSLRLSYGRLHQLMGTCVCVCVRVCVAAQHCGHGGRGRHEGGTRRLRPAGQMRPLALALAHPAGGGEGGQARGAGGVAHAVLEHGGHVLPRQREHASGGATPITNPLVPC
eukprot:5873317-Pyramimonas_sp.AAC.1